MTEGSTLKLLVQFTLPLIAGNILQLTYNAVDSIILGRFVGSGELAAVGTSNPLMSLLIMFMQGISLGCAVLIGHLFGGGETERLRRQVSTGMVSGCVFALILTVPVVPGAPILLRILQVDEAILEPAVLYLRIVGLGLIFNFIYNYFSSVLRALGDSVTPLYFLTLSAGLNIVGDIVAVVVFKLGIAGCALSTLVLCVFLKDWFLFDRTMFRKTVTYGSVTAIQQSTIQMGILGVQAIVNSMGAAATAGFAAANRIDDFSLIPGRNIANAMTAVMAQNDGAGKKERVKKAFFVGMALETGFGVTASVLLFLFYGAGMRLFTDEAPVLMQGETYLRLIALMYLMPALTNGIQGYFRGIGNMKITLVASIMNMGMRFLSCMLYVFIFKMGIEAVPWACFTGWLAMSVLEVPILIRSIRKL